MSREREVGSKVWCRNRVDLTAQMPTSAILGIILCSVVKVVDLEGLPEAGLFLAQHTALIPQGKQCQFIILHIPHKVGPCSSQT